MATDLLSSFSTLEDPRVERNKRHSSSRYRVSKLFLISRIYKQAHKRIQST